MKLPNAANAVVEKSKIVEYLLNSSHPDNGGKAQFFFSMGFSVHHWEVLSKAFREAAANLEIFQCTSTPHGVKYQLHGPLTTPIGAQPTVRSVWIIDTGSAVPRLVTAFPR